MLKQIRDCLAQAHGDRFRGAILYGSEARGTATADSDIDVLVLLSGPISLWRDIRTSIDALYPLSLSFGRPISTYPATREQYEQYDCPLFRNIHQEGVST